MATVSNSVSFGRQIVRREVNTRIRSVNGSIEPATIEIFCECGRRLCADRVQIATDVYESVLRSPGQYVVTPHHDHDPTQRLVSRHHGFLVVKRDGS
jgi:hypothetical protein